MNIFIKLRSLYILLFASILFSTNSYGQNLLQNDKFSYAPMFGDQIVLIKEIPLKSTDIEKNFYLIKEWGKERYSHQPLISNIRYDNRNREIIIRSKIELLLPENKDKVREKIVMNYSLNIFIVDNKSVFEAKDITYKLSKVKQPLFAENTISESALKIKDSQQELRKNIQLSTLFFFNELAESLDLLLKSTD